MEMVVHYIKGGEGTKWKLNLKSILGLEVKLACFLCFYLGVGDACVSVSPKRIMERYLFLMIIIGAISLLQLK